MHNYRVKTCLHDLNKSYWKFQSFHLLCYTDSYFSFSAVAAEVEVIPAPSSSHPRTTQALMKKQLKEKEDKRKHRKAIEKATGAGPPPVKKPKPTKFTHSVARQYHRKVIPNNTSSKPYNICILSKYKFNV